MTVQAICDKLQRWIHDALRGNIRIRERGGWLQLSTGSHIEESAAVSIGFCHIVHDGTSFADGLLAALYSLLDSIQDSISESTTLPFPRDGGSSSFPLVTIGANGVVRVGFLNRNGWQVIYSIGNIAEWRSALSMDHAAVGRNYKC